MKNISAYNKRTWIFFLLLAVLLVVVRLPSFAETLENDSGSVAFFARQMIRGHILYDTFHPAHHLPGIYYTFELAFRLFGDHANAPKLLLLPWTFICAFLLFQMGRTYFDEQTGRLAAVFFILITSQRGFAGMTVEMEHFANLPLIAGIYLLMNNLRRKSPDWQFIWVGLAGSFSILYKVIFVAPLVVAGIVILLAAWDTRKEMGVWRTMISRLIWMAIGLIVPLAIVATYFASLGLWQRFMLLFELGFNYFGAGVKDFSNLPPLFGYPLFWFSVNNVALLFLGLVGIYRLTQRSGSNRNTDLISGLILILWLVISLAMAGSRGGGFAHYCLPVIPPLVFVSSIGIRQTYQQWRISSERLSNLWASSSVALVIILFIWSNYNLYHNYSMYLVNSISHDEFLQKTYRDGFVSQQISRYIQAHTEPDDFIYLWSLYVDVYYYADRMPPVDILWPTYLETTGSPGRIFTARTKYILVDLPKQGSLPKWLTDGLASDYKLETIIEDTQIYRLRSN